MESPAEQSSCEAHLAALQSLGRSHLPSATKVTPNDDGDYDPFPFDYCSSCENSTLDPDNTGLFLANNDFSNLTDDDDYKKSSLLGSPIHQHLFDDLVDVENNDVLGFKLTKSKSTTFFDDMAKERKNYETSTTYGAYPEDDCFLGRPEDHVNNNNEPQSQPGNTGWGLPPPQQQQQRPDNSKPPPQRPREMPWSSPAAGLEAVLRMEREEHEMQLKHLQDQIRKLKEQEHNKQQQQGPPSSSVQSPPQQRPPAQQQPPLYAQRPMGSYPPSAQQQQQQYNDDFTNTTPDTTTTVTTVTDRQVTEKTTTEGWGSFFYSMATGGMAALGIVKTKTSKKRESSTKNAGNTLTGGGVDKNAATSKKRESSTENAGNTGIGGGVDKNAATSKKRESSTENAGNTGIGGGVDKNAATSKKRKSSTENAGNTGIGGGRVTVASTSGSALASAKKRQKRSSTIDSEIGGKRQQTWEKRRKELVKYRDTVGDTNVPYDYEENKQLGPWVSRQRTGYKLLKQGEPTTMTLEKIQSLNECGFLWEAKMKDTNTTTTTLLLPENFEPSDWDVIVRDGGQNINHVGNRRLRELIENNEPRFRTARSDTAKNAVIQDILMTVQRQSPSGVGLVRKNPTTNRWSYIGHKKAKGKIRQALVRAGWEVDLHHHPSASVSTSAPAMTSKKRKSSMEYAGNNTTTGDSSFSSYEKAGTSKKRKSSVECAGTGTTVTGDAGFSPFGESSSHSSPFRSSATSTHQLCTTGTGGGGGYSLVTHNKDKAGTSKKNEKKAPNPDSLIDLTSSDTAGHVLPLSVLGTTLPNLAATTTALPMIAAHAGDEPPSPRRPVSKHDQKWNAMMMKLLEFKETHTHTLVPQNYKDDPRLGRWVYYQRVEYWLLQQAQPAKITEERINRLEAIDFEWDPQIKKRTMAVLPAVIDLTETQDKHRTTLLGQLLEYHLHVMNSGIGNIDLHGPLVLSATATGISFYNIMHNLGKSNSNANYCKAWKSLTNQNLIGRIKPDTTLSLYTSEFSLTTSGLKEASILLEREGRKPEKCAYVCDHCKKNFSSKQRLKYHVDRNVCNQAAEATSFTHEQPRVPPSSLAQEGAPLALAGTAQAPALVERQRQDPHVPPSPALAAVAQETSTKPAAVRSQHDYDIEELASGAIFNSRTGRHTGNSVNEYISHENNHFELRVKTDENDKTVFDLGGRVPPCIRANLSTMQEYLDGYRPPRPENAPAGNTKIVLHAFAHMKSHKVFPETGPPQFIVIGNNDGAALNERLNSLLGGKIASSIKDKISGLKHSSDGDFVIITLPTDDTKTATIWFYYAKEGCFRYKRDIGDSVKKLTDEIASVQANR